MKMKNICKGFNRIFGSHSSIISAITEIEPIVLKDNNNYLIIKEINTTKIINLGECTEKNMVITLL